MAERRCVVLDYQGRSDSEPQRREVDPWALHLVDGSWYLQGHDHRAEAMRTFRLDRVAGLQVTDDAVGLPAPDDLPPPRYHPGPDDLQVVLDLTVAGRWLLDAVDTDEVVDRDDGGARAHLRTDAPSWLARLVLTAGGEATVVAPDHLREQVGSLAAAALARYRPG